MACHLRFHDPCDFGTTREDVYALVGVGMPACIASGSPELGIHKEVTPQQLGLHRHVLTLYSMVSEYGR